MCFVYIVVEPVAESIKAEQGQHIILSCGRRRVDYRLNGLPIYRYHAGEITDGHRGRFSFNSTTEQQGDLVIAGITHDDEGEYTCCDPYGGHVFKKYTVEGNLQCFIYFSVSSPLVLNKCKKCFCFITACKVHR